MKVPKSALIFKNSDEGSVEVFAEGERNKFRLVGNSGKPFDSGFFGKMIIDFENLRLRKSPMVVLREHDALLVAGTAKKTSMDEGLVFDGKFSGSTTTATELQELLAEGVKFEASIRVEAKAIDFIDKGDEVKINGQTVKGPIRVLRNNTVSEVSFVLFGQDPKTSGKMIASESNETVEIIENKYRKEPIMAEENKTVITEQQLADAAISERNRITAINAELPGDALVEVRKQAIAEGKTVDEAKSMAFSVMQKTSEAEVAQLRADNQAKDERLAAIAAGGGDTDLSGQNTDGEDNNSDQSGENKYLAEQIRLVNLGKSGKDAVLTAARKYPEEHRKWVEQQRYVP
jgi:hypothetical protein